MRSNRLPVHTILKTSSITKIIQKQSKLKCQACSKSRPSRLHNVLKDGRNAMFVDRFSRWTICRTALLRREKERWGTRDIQMSGELLEYFLGYLLTAETPTIKQLN